MLFLEILGTCSIDSRGLSEVFVVMGFVMSLFAMNYIVFGLLTQFKVKDCVEFTTYAYWPTVICTGITQFALHWWVWPVFLGSWPFGPIPSTDYNDKSAERFCEKTHFQAAFGFLVIDMIIGLIVIFSWFWKLFKWCGLCCCCCCCAHCLGMNYVNFLADFTQSSYILRRPQNFAKSSTNF